MKILITGASSYVGSKIYSVLSSIQKYSITGTFYKNKLFDDLIELDLTDHYKVEKFISLNKPEVIIHVANYPSGRDYIGNENKFVKLNSSATKCIVKCANENDSKIIFISSQAALSGRDNAYGQLKAESELEVSKATSGYLILRPSLIIGISPNSTKENLNNKILKCVINSDKLAEFDTSWILQPTYLDHIPWFIQKLISDKSWNKTLSLFYRENVTLFKIANDILSRFNLSAKPIDKKLNIKLSDDSVSVFESMSVYPFTYQEMVYKIVEDIRSYVQNSKKL